MMELLIALLIMTIMTFVFMGYYTKIVTIQKDAELYLQATTLASSTLEKILSERKTPIQNQQKEGLFSIDWHIIPQSLSVPEFHTLDVTQLVLIEVIVSWQSIMKATRKITLRSAFSFRAEGIT